MEIVIADNFMNRNIPIKNRKTNYTKFLSDELSDYISNNKVSYIEIDLDLSMNTPFPALSQASKSLSIPIVDPHSVIHLVMDSLPELEDEELFVNSDIVFEKQALLIMEATIYGVIQCLASLLQPYFPRSADFEEAFKKALTKIKPIIDSIFIDSEAKFEAEMSIATDEKFEEIVHLLNEEEE